MNIGPQEIFNYIKGALDHLTMAFSVTERVSKETSLVQRVGPLLVQELRDRGYGVISLEEISELNNTLDYSKLDKNVIKILKEYNKTIEEIAKGG